MGASELDAALDLCARDRPAGVFVAARLAEGALTSHPGSVLGHYSDGQLDGLVWAAANVVPVGLTTASIPAMASKLDRLRRVCASLFGPTEQVYGLWDELEPSWGPVRAIRSYQPLMATTSRPSELGLHVDNRVRLAEPGELDLVVPAAADMFTEEIGYPPFVGSDRGYRRVVRQLIERGHTYVIVEGGRVLFKADVGSLAMGEAQLQGVWVAHELRGRGLAVPAMAAVVEHLLSTDVDEVSLYVNHYNRPARATYQRLGFREVGSFTTVLL